MISIPRKGFSTLTRNMSSLRMISIPRKSFSGFNRNKNYSVLAPGSNGSGLQVAPGSNGNGLQRTQDTLWEYFVAATSARCARWLCTLSPEKAATLIRIVSATQRLEAKVMSSAIGGPSKYSVVRTYDHQAAATAFSRVVCPLVVCAAGYLGTYEYGRITSKFQDASLKEQLDGREALFRISILEEAAEMDNRVELRQSSKVKEVDSRLELGQAETALTLAQVMRSLLARLEVVEKKVEKKSETSE